MQSETTTPRAVAVRTPQDADGAVPPAVSLRDVRHRFGALEVIAGLTLHIAPGETVALVGPSGCGKSTLLEIACGLLVPGAGTVSAPPAALVPQRDALLPWADALDNAALPLRLQHVSRADARRRAEPLLAGLGLAGFERVRPAELSGGMRQRVAFARALLTGRGVLCLDEPFGALDAITRAEIHRWLAGALAAQPRTVLLVTHDIEEALVLADRVCVLSPRPARIVAELAVTGTRPRDPADPALVDLRRRALEALRAC